MGLDLTQSVTGQSGKVTDAATALRPWLRDGMSIGLGGFGLERKPMVLIREILAAGVRELRVESFAGGLDVEWLLAHDRLAKVAACHVGLDHFGLAPLFRAARERGSIQFEEWSELTQLAAWQAAANKAPYGVVPMDPKSQLREVNPAIRPAPSLWDDAGDCVAVRAPSFDLAVLHVEAAHPEGWCTALGDPYLDRLLARAADRVVVSAERLMSDAELEERHRDVHLWAATVDSIVLAPGGALPGSCLPDYMIDFKAMRGYVEAEPRPDILAALIAAAVPAGGAA